MSNRRGVTLVELMIVVAMLGIMTACLGDATRRIQLLGLAELQQEQAQLMLEYHARCAMNGQRDPGLPEPMSSSLPGAQITHNRTGDLLTLSITWDGPAGSPATRSMTVFTP